MRIPDDASHLVAVRFVREAFVNEDGLEPNVPHLQFSRSARLPFDAQRQHFAIGTVLQRLDSLYAIDDRIIRVGHPQHQVEPERGGNLAIARPGYYI